MKPFPKQGPKDYFMRSDPVQSEFGVADLLNYFQTRLQNDGAEKLTVQHLERVCWIILRKQQNNTFGKPFSTETINHVVEASVETRDLSLLANASTELKGLLPIHVYSKIGENLRSVDFKELQPVYVLPTNSLRPVH
jgi:hypothetical protein